MFNKIIKYLFGLLL